jgi:hypothetical protein
MQHQYYSQRTGDNPHNSGLPLCKIIYLFEGIFIGLSDDGYFEEAFGYKDPDGSISLGKVRDIPLQILSDFSKEDLWPIIDHSNSYSESDLFDMIEFLYHHVSKPTGPEATLLTSRGFTWTDFDRSEGRQEYREKINRLLNCYENKFVFMEQGEVWRRPEDGFEEILNVDIPSEDKIIVDLINTAVRNFRKHGASSDDRGHAVRDLADVLEMLRKDIKNSKIVTNADENDLFIIANKFGIRHKNDQQKTAYDKSTWLSWMFYFYLATIHVLLKSKDRRNESKQENIF